ncbi:MAG: RHS repeat-associated core domain-containing protein [Sphingomicrobium sp.]|nr:hypothetical protein [Sphingomonadales bacterium]
MKLGALSRALVCLACAVLLTTPAQSRFLQVDPVGYQDQINLYEYVGDDPLNHNDPTGKESGSTACMFGACDGPQTLNLDPQTARAGLIGMVVIYTGGVACAVGGCEAALAGIARNAGALKTVVAIERQAERASLLRQAGSLEKGAASKLANAADHEQRAAEFAKNPTVRPGMEGQPKEVIAGQQQARVDHLRSEAAEFRNQARQDLQAAVRLKNDADRLQ